MAQNPSLASILDQLPEVRKALAPHIHHTPLIQSRLINRTVGHEVRFKAENLQRSGSFKARGAHWKCLGLQDQTAGVATYSSGNHGQAVALAAQSFGLEAVICVPETIPSVKEAAMRDYGARVVHAGKTSTERRARATEIAQEEGLTIVPPFDDPEIIAGQGTAALELLEDWPEVERIVVPVGGGGLLAGTICATKLLDHPAEIIAVEARGAPTLHAALEAGEPINLDGTHTIADGLCPLRIGDLNFRIARERDIRSILVSDESILEAMRLLLTRTKLFVEPSAAAAFAPLLTGELPPRPTCVVLSGGNLSPEDLAHLFPPPGSGANP